MNLAIREQGWILDFKRFYIYLKENYGVSKAFMFIGYVKENEKLYEFLRKVGYICVFKPTLTYSDGHTKGNCDAELVLQTMIEFNKFDKAIIVTGDGDFYCLIKYLIEKCKLSAVLIPNEKKFSALLYFIICRPFLRYMNDLRSLLEYKKKRPHEDETS
jgi:uncharacterized LabA/DUF88 family protein